MVGAQRMSVVLPDKCGGATREPAHCCGATSKSGFPTVQASSCAQHPLNALKLPGSTTYLPSDHLVQIHDGQCPSNQKTQPTVIFDRLIRAFFFLVEENLYTSTATITSWFQHHTHKPMSHLLL